MYLEIRPKREDLHSKMITEKKLYVDKKNLFSNIYNPDIQYNY